MIRRIIMVAAAAAALTLVPSAAMAYNAPGFNSTVSDSTPAIGQPVTIVITGADADEPVTLTITSDPASISSDAIQIAGTKSLTKNANASGVATFTVTLTAAASYALTATNAAGAVLSTQTLTVAAATPAAAGTLPRTGFDVMGFGLWGGLFVLVGAGALIVVKRRRPAQVRA